MADTVIEIAKLIHTFAWILKNMALVKRRIPN